MTEDEFKKLKLPQSIDEIIEYYKNCFEKWYKWQIESPEKLPEEYRSKSKFDFKKILDELDNSVNQENKILKAKTLSSFFSLNKFWKVASKSKEGALNSYFFLSLNDPNLNFLYFTLGG